LLAEVDEYVGLLCVQTHASSIVESFIVLTQNESGDWTDRILQVTVKSLIECDMVSMENLYTFDLSSLTHVDVVGA
jgi:hypothetical protein